MPSARGVRIAILIQRAGVDFPRNARHRIVRASVGIYRDSVDRLVLNVEDRQVLINGTEKGGLLHEREEEYLEVLIDDR